jgi:putative FmdB family regulatory protein
MPIYAYKCATCGFSQDEMQKVSDALLTVCPSCGQATYAKQVTAAGFALKGTGWYATDFKGGGSKPAETKPAETKPDTPAPACGTGACPACN